MLPCPWKGASSMVLELVVNDNNQGIIILGEPESSNWLELYDQSEIIKMLMSATGLYKKSNIQENLAFHHQPWAEEHICSRGRFKAGQRRGKANTQQSLPSIHMLHDTPFVILKPQLSSWSPAVIHYGGWLLQTPFMLHLCSLHAPTTRKNLINASIRSSYWRSTFRPPWGSPWVHVSHQCTYEISFILTLISLDGETYNNSKKEI